MNKKMFLHNLALTVITLLVLGFSTAQVETNFPADFAGTWKRDKYNNTLTFTSNTINDSNQDNSWEIQSISRDTYKIKSANTTRIITIKINKDNLVISGDKGSGQNNWNGTWKKQAVAGVTSNFTGSGGKGTSLAILAPKATGLAENQSYLPALVQGEFVSNFSGFSAIEILDRERLDDQYAELLSGYYDDNAQAGFDLGRLTPTTHIMGGNITRTATGYALQMQITRTADKMTTASYSGTFTFAELDNLTGIRRASLELLQKMGVTLTAQAQGELAGAATENRVNAQTALARGITAQKQGTEVAALSYYFQAAAFDPSLTEAINRSSILNANISSGNIGENVRNDIQWRKDWVARLTETENSFYQMINAADPPYSLFYSIAIEQGAVNYQTETVSLSIPINLHGLRVWFNSVQKALQAVYEGLNATNRKDVWGLGNWPVQGVSNSNPFARGKQYDISIVFELVNEHNRVIGRQTVNMKPSFSFSGWGKQVKINYTENDYNTVRFNTVNANDITNNLTIRIASVNGAVPETTRFRITAVSDSKWNEYRDYRTVYNYLRIENGVLLGFNPSIFITETYYGSNSQYNYVAKFHPSVSKSQIQQVRNFVLPTEQWGEPLITSIADNAFRLERQHQPHTLTDITIPNGVTYIGEAAFYNNDLTSIVIPNSVTYIGDSAFLSNYNLTKISIGSNVKIDPIDPEVYVYFSNQIYTKFITFYESNGRKAGTYTYNHKRPLDSNSLTMRIINMIGNKDAGWVYNP